MAMVGAHAFALTRSGPPPPTVIAVAVPAHTLPETLLQNLVCGAGQEAIARIVRRLKIDVVEPVVRPVRTVLGPDGRAFNVGQQ